MITIDCSEIKELMVELAAHISQQTSTLGLIKSQSVVLDPLTGEDPGIDDVVAGVKSFLALRELSSDFTVKAEDKNVRIISVSGKKVKAIKTDLGMLGMLECPHCGKITLYEEEMNVHIKAHYVGF